MNDYDKLKLHLLITSDFNKRVKMWKKYIDKTPVSTLNSNLMSIFDHMSSTMETEVIIKYLFDKTNSNNIVKKDIFEGKTKYYIELSESLLHQFNMLVMEEGIILTKMAVISQNTFMMLGDRETNSDLIIDLENGKVHISSVSKEIHDSYYVETKIKDNTIAFGMCNMIKNAADQWTESTPFIGESVCNHLSDEASKKLSSYGMSLVLTQNEMKLFKHGKEISYECAIREIIEKPLDTINFNNTFEHEKFLEYLQLYSHDDLMDIFIEQYYKLKGRSNLIPYTGKNGGLEFVGAVLLWKYANEKLKTYRSKLQTYGPLIIGLADTIGLAFNSMDPVSWSDKMDIVINTSEEVLTYDEWSEVYRYLDANLSTYIHMLDFTKDKSFDERLYLDSKFKSFSSIYNSLPNFESIVDYYDTQGLGFKREIWFEIGN